MVGQPNRYFRMSSRTSSELSLAHIPYSHFSNWFIHSSLLLLPLIRAQFELYIAWANEFLYENHKIWNANVCSVYDYQVDFLSNWRDKKKLSHRTRSEYIYKVFWYKLYRLTVFRSLWSKARLLNNNQACDDFLIDILELFGLERSDFLCCYVCACEWFDTICAYRMWQWQYENNTHDLQ